MRKTGRYLSAAEATVTERRPTADFEGGDVLVIAERDDQVSFLTRELQRLRVSLRHIWPLPDVIPCDADMIYCDYCHDLSRRIPWVPGDAKAALVVILPHLQPVDPDAVAHLAPNAVLARPFNANSILASFVVARSQFRYEQRLLGKVDRLDENLRALRTVERAKAILMSTRRLTSDEAYNFIRRQAMDKRVSVSGVAAAIVASHELLGSIN